jgi:hypothetical protein
MADYTVRFTVHLIPFLKPEGWENPVFHYAGPFRAKDFSELKYQVDRYLLAIARQQGIITLKNSKKPLEENIETMDLRVYVPMHIVSYMEQDTTKLVTDVPDENDEELFLQ